MKLRYHSIIFIIISLCFACETIDNSTDNYLRVNGADYSLSVINISDKGYTSGSPGYQTYEVNISTPSYASTENFISFRLYSPLENELSDGTYSYNYLTAANYCSYVEIGFDLQYDSNEDVIAGTILTEDFIDYSYNNTITVDEEASYFSFDLKFSENDSIYTIKGEYTDNSL